MALSNILANSSAWDEISLVWALAIAGWFADITSWVTVCVISVISDFLRTVDLTTATAPIVRNTHIRNCVSPTRAIPIIFPIISSEGFTEETITSTTRLVFSSITPLMTCDPKMNTSMYISNPPI